jgi:hypothetical protein
VLAPGGTLALVDNLSPDAEALPEAAGAALRDAAMAYNAFETLRDPSHARCLGLGEWVQVLEDAGFVGARFERMGQDIAFGPWTQRMRCDATTVGRLKAMLGDAPLRGFLNPRMSGSGLVFTLQEAIVVARKPVRE